MLWTKPKNLSKPHLLFTEKYGFMLWNTDLNFGWKVTVGSEFCLLLSLKEKKKKKVTAIQWSLRLGIKKVSWRFSLLWECSSPGLPGQCKMAACHEALLTSCPSSRTESSEPLPSILLRLALNTLSIFCWPESLCAAITALSTPQKSYLKVRAWPEA